MSRPTNVLTVTVASILALLFILVPFSSVASAATAPPQTWSHTLSVGTLDTGQDVAIDRDGNVVAVGIVEQRTSSGTVKQMVATKLSSDGEVQWRRLYALGQSDRLEGVVLDDAGNAYVAGTIRTTIGDDAFVRKLDPDGQPLWTKRIDKGTQEIAHAIDLDADGNVVIAGTSSSMNGLDGFVAKLDPTGKELWARAINLYLVDEVFDVATFSDGSIITVGRTVAGSDVNLLLRKYYPNGTTMWTQTPGNPAQEEARGVVTLDDGTFLVSGTQNEPENNQTNYNHFVAHFDANGEKIWKRTFDDGGREEGRGVTVDPWGNVLTVGISSGYSGTRDGILRKVDAAGEAVWTKTYDGGRVDGFGAVAVNAKGMIAVSGATQRTNSSLSLLVVQYREPVPTVHFENAPATADAEQEVRFVANATAGTGDLTRIHWDLGDGTTAASAHPTTTYAYPYGGTYTVRITVEDEGGLTATATHRITVDGPPRPSGTDTDGTDTDDTGNDTDPDDEDTTGDETDDGGDGTDTSDNQGAPAPGVAMLLLVLGGLSVGLRHRRGA